MDGESGAEITKQVVAEKTAIERQKEQQRQAVKSEFSYVTDSLGLAIDPGILDTVVALNVLGVNTFQSCEGHSDLGTGAPYIDIEAKRTPELEMLENQATTDFQEAAAALKGISLTQEIPDQIQQLYAQAHQLKAEASKPHLQERQKAMNYLDEFYKDRQVPYDRRLIIVPLFEFGESRIESQGADLQRIAPQDVKERKLQEYQGEMREFTLFLKEKYFMAKS
jgi:hypothetical protein